MIDISNSCGVYKLYWPNSKFYYIGQSKNIHKRYLLHIRSFKCRKKVNRKLLEAYDLLGEPKLSIIFLCNPEELDFVEQSHLDLNYNKDGCCNVCPIVSVGQGLLFHNAETRKIIGEKSKKKIYTTEYRKNMSEAQIRRKNTVNKYVGRPASEESKLKMSKSRRGVKKSEEHKRKIGEAHKGQKHYNFGGTISDSTKKKLSISLSMENNPRAKKVICITTGEIFNCAKIVSISTGINYSTLRANLQRQSPNYNYKYL